MATHVVRALLCMAPVIAAIVIVPAADVASWGNNQMDSAVEMSTPASCPVTVANGNTPPGERPTPGRHGNGELWTSLWPDGTVLIRPEDVQPDGSMAMKWPWWRGVPGQLFIEGRRLDAPAPPLRAEAPGGRRLDIPVTPSAGTRSSDGAEGFQATALVFPTEGCWEVTGWVGDANLTFVVRVERVERWPWMPTATPEPSP